MKRLLGFHGDCLHFCSENLLIWNNTPRKVFSVVRFRNWNKGCNAFKIDLPVISTLGWSVSENDTEWKLASEVTCRGEKLILRTATVRGWQPHPGVLKRACLATLLMVLMTGMFSVRENNANIFKWYPDCDISQTSAKNQFLADQSFF